jgi:hypothetical protein
VTSKMRIELLWRENYLRVHRDVAIQLSRFLIQILRIA